MLTVSLVLGNFEPMFSNLNRILRSAYERITDISTAHHRAISWIIAS